MHSNICHNLKYFRAYYKVNRKKEMQSYIDI